MFDVCFTGKLRCFVLNVAAGIFPKNKNSLLGGMLFARGPNLGHGQVNLYHILRASSIRRLLLLSPLHMAPHSAVARNFL